MTIDQFITKYTGQKVRGGQCGELVRQYWIDVDQTDPPSYENSKDYWFNPVPGYDKVSSPQNGDIAIYNGHGNYPEGHIGIYYNGQIFEENADPDGAPAHLFKRTSPYLLGYLRKQGGEDMPTQGDVNRVIYLGLRRKATQPELDKFSKLGWGKLFDYVESVQNTHNFLPRAANAAQAIVDKIKSLVGA